MITTYDDDYFTVEMNTSISIILMSKDWIVRDIFGRYGCTHL